MRGTVYVLLLLGSVLLLSGCGSSSNVCVVGVAECELMPLEKEETAEKVTLTAGTTLTIVNEEESQLEVITPTGERGTVWRIEVCSQSEYRRRKDAGEIPQRLIRVASGKEGMFFYGGAVSIRNNQFVIEAGQGIWMGDSTRGETLTISSKKFEGNPDILYLLKEDGSVAELELLPPPATSKSEEEPF